MSKEFSANIHDPNHTADDYDIFFNGDQIETASTMTKQILRAVATAPSDTTTTELTFTFDADNIPDDAVYVTPGKPICDSSNLMIAFTYQGGFNSIRNTCICCGGTQGQSVAMGALLSKSNQNKTVTLKLTSNSFTFYTGSYEMYCIYWEAE